MRCRRIVVWAASLCSVLGPAITQEVEPPPNPVPELLKLMASGERDVRLAAVEHFGALLVGGNPFLRPHENPIAKQASTRLVMLYERDPDADVALAAGLTLIVLAWPSSFAMTHLPTRLADWEREGAAASPIAVLRAALADASPSPAAILEPLTSLAIGPTCPGALVVLTMLGHDARAVAPQLVKKLGQEPASERWRVALTLAGIGCATELAPALADPDPRVRVAASLAHLRDAAAEPLPDSAVVPWLTDRLTVVQDLAIRAVPRLAGPPADAVRAVAELLEDPLLHPAVDQTLLALGPRAAPAVPILVRHLAPASRDPAVRSLMPESLVLARFAIGELGAIGSAAEAAVEPLAQLAAEDDHGGQAFSHAGGRALARIAPTKAVPLLMRAFESDLGIDRDGWWNSALTLRAMGDAAVPELARFVGVVEHGSTAARANAMNVLAAFGPKALPALPAVLQQLDHANNWLWPMALEVIRAIGPAAAPVVIPRLSKRYGDSDLSDYHRLHIVLRLHQLGAAAEPLLLRGSADADVSVRWAADEALVNLQELSTAGAAHIANLLAITDATLPPGLRVAPWRYLGRSLEEVDTVPPRLKALLPPLLDHPDFLAFAAIARIFVRDLYPATRGHHAWESLFAASDRPTVRKALADRKALASWVRSMSEHANLEVRHAAAILLPLLND